MVSDFITETDGFLCLTEEEYQAAKRSNPDIKMSARKLSMEVERRILDIRQVHEIDGICSKGCRG